MLMMILMLVVLVQVVLVVAYNAHALTDNSVRPTHKHTPVPTTNNLQLLGCTADTVDRLQYVCVWPIALCSLVALAQTLIARSSQR